MSTSTRLDIPAPLSSAAPWWRRLTWRATLSWPAFTITLIYVVTVNTVASTALYSTSLALRLIAHAIGAIAAYIVLWIAGVILRARQHGNRAWVGVVAAMMLASGFCGVVTGWAVVLLGLTPDTDIAYRLPISILVITPGLILATLTTESWSSHRSQVRALLQEQARLAAARDRLERSIDDDISALVRTQTDQITRLLDDLDDTDPVACLAMLRSVSDDLVRPLSHRLAREGGSAELPEPELTQPRTTFGQFLVDVTSPAGIRPLPFAAILSALWAGFGLAFSAFASAPVLGATGFAVLLVTAWLARQAYIPVHRVMSRRGSVLILLAIQIGLYAAVGAVTLTAIRFTGQLRISEIPVAFAEVVFVLVGIALSAQAAATVQRALTEAELQQINDELAIQIGRAQILSWQAKQQLSRRIHGALQSAFNAASVRLDILLRTGDYDPTMLAGLIVPIRQALADLLAPEPRIDVKTELERIAGVWSGACTVTVHAAPQVLEDLNADPAIASVVIEITTELTSNAVRHGRADRIDIKLTTADEGVITITAQDDGSGIDAGTPGLGTLLLDRTTLRWERIRGAQGTTVECALPAPKSTTAVVAAARPEGI